MKSRVHLSLSYAPPIIEIRRRIWLHSLKKVPADDKDTNLDKTIDELEKIPLNGREIANAVNTARTLARFDGVRLSSSHIEAVLQVRQGFDESLKNGEIS